MFPNVVYGLIEGCLVSRFSQPIASSALAVLEWKFSWVTKYFTEGHEVTTLQSGSSWYLNIIQYITIKCYYDFILILSYSRHSSNHCPLLSSKINFDIPETQG